MVTPADSRPLISVVIATYNRCESLLRCVASFAEQSLAPDRYEIVVVNDGSTDDTAQAIGDLQLAPALRLVSQTNQGRAAARNAGIAAARAELVLFSDDDIVATPQYVAQHLEAHEQNRSRQVSVLGRCDYPPEYLDNALMRYLDGSKMVLAYASMSSGQMYDWRTYYTGAISTPRQALEKIGGFDESFRRYGCEDTDLGVRLQQQLGYQIYYHAPARAFHCHRLDLDGLKRRQIEIARAHVKLLQTHPHLLRSAWKHEADLTLAKCETTLAEQREQTDQAEAVARQLTVLNLGQLEAFDPALKSYTDATVRLLEMSLKMLNARWWEMGFAAGFRDLGLTGFADLAPKTPKPEPATKPWPLSTKAQYVVLAWPRYDSVQKDSVPKDLELLLTEYAPVLRQVEGCCLALRHDPELDGPLQSAVEGLQKAQAQFGPATDPLELLLVNDRMNAQQWPRLGQAVHCVVQLPSGSGGQRQAFASGVGAPVVHSAAELRKLLNP